MQNKTILVVKDDEAICDLLRTVLEDLMGARVVKALGGADALQAVLATEPALVILDACLPGVDGIGVLQQLKAHPTTKDIPVLVLSADHNLRRRALAAGCASFIDMPFDLEVLLATVQDHLGCGGERSLRWGQIG
jgi:CheY-like chemotaxis protein